MSTKPPALRRQRGATTVEVALASLVFFLFLLGWMELARYMYLLNLSQEVARRAARAAAITDFSDSAAMAQLRQQAMFGAATLDGTINGDNLAIDYLRLDAAGALQPASPMPASPAGNAFNCLRDPQGASCIRFVRVRWCGNGGACPSLPFISPAQLPLQLALPRSTVVVRAESLGFTPGAPLSP
ncbi:TadE/TadG family type IV pilus assembly protein [Pseudoduganella violacea]|uniref:TadE-like domain-containing protein n=1 Tax=Pseudoduganella violacea TaxID=1715466 RepID=A0A7W5FRS1_9BURK|nr:TadE family protein [Pseudoduganella violacea]MBB3117004.1 hypothetical protein [Pseudoduganella violacea]